MFSLKGFSILSRGWRRQGPTLMRGHSTLPCSSSSAATCTPRSRRAPPLLAASLAPTMSSTSHARHEGHTARAADYARSIGVVHRTGRAVARFFARYDVYLTPTMARPHHPLGILDMMTDDDVSGMKSVSKILACGVLAVVAQTAMVTDVRAQTPFYRANANELDGPPGTLIRQEHMSGAPLSWSAIWRWLRRNRKASRHRWLVDDAPLAGDESRSPQPI
jgi:hypothetical protein